MSADHRVSWDHSGCEHGSDEESYCSAVGTITCEAVGPGVSYCRWTCDPGGTDSYNTCEEGWTLCTDDADHIAPGEPEPDPEDDERPHHDPAVPHCIYGHPMVLMECNALLAFDGSSVEDSYDDLNPLAEYRDGPVRIFYEGDGVYLWSYAVDIPGQAM